jgi:hypothetical protein
MLIVGSTAALIAIAVYLAWHFLNRWRVSLRRRRAEARIAVADARREREAERFAEAREFHPAPGE